MTGHNIDFIALDFTLKRSGLLLGDEALAAGAWSCAAHHLYSIPVPGQFAGWTDLSP